VTTLTLLEHLHDPANHAAWGRMVGVFQPILVRLATRRGFSATDAEDIAQQSFAEFARSYLSGAYRQERGRLRDWLFGIARNQMSARRRQLSRAARDEQPRPGDALTSDETSDHAWETEWRDAVIRLCLERVAAEVEPHTYEAFILFAVKGQRAADVAARLGMSENAVFLGKRRILGLMRAYITQMEEEV
jgi:RNA polymerase sigma-70 factor (ECF subfamily)